MASLCESQMPHTGLQGSTWSGAFLPLWLIYHLFLSPVHSSPTSLLSSNKMPSSSYLGASVFPIASNGWFLLPQVSAQISPPQRSLHRNILPKVCPFHKLPSSSYSLWHHSISSKVVTKSCTYFVDVYLCYCLSLLLECALYEMGLICLLRLQVLLSKMVSCT